VTELVISEITRMAGGFCVIGVERAKGHVRSLRPVPPYSNYWKKFPVERGARVTFKLSLRAAQPPHMEDRNAEYVGKASPLSESELVFLLRKAEVGATTQELFGCTLQASAQGGGALWACPEEATRSICGCEVVQVSFSFRWYPGQLRLGLVLPSGEGIQSLPVVDRDWNLFVERLAEQIPEEEDRRPRLRDFFEVFVEEQIKASPRRFARLGIARPKDGCCWLMLDTLFPLPRPEWVDEFKRFNSPGA
jgi:hypothetical protein